MWEFRLIELLTCYSRSFIDIRLQCLYDRKYNLLCIYRIYSYMYMTFGMGWEPQTCDLLRLHLTFFRSCAHLFNN
jgi:hypothetical protein